MQSFYFFDIVDGSFTKGDLERRFLKTEGQIEDFSTCRRTNSFYDSLKIVETDKGMTEEEAETYIQGHNDMPKTAFATKLIDGRWYVGGWYGE